MVFHLSFTKQNYPNRLVLLKSRKRNGIGRFFFLIRSIYAWTKKYVFVQFFKTENHCYCCRMLTTDEWRMRFQENWPVPTKWSTELCKSLAWCIFFPLKRLDQLPPFSRKLKSTLSSQRKFFQPSSLEWNSWLICTCTISKSICLCVTFLRCLLCTYIA